MRPRIETPPGHARDRLRPVPRTAATPAVALVVGLVVALVVGLAAACTGSDDGPAAPRPSATTSAALAPADPAALQVRLRRVTGRLPQSQRAAVADQVARVVGTWFDAAYLGDFPRTDFAPAFAGFTGTAASRARHSAALMTNARIAGRIDTAQALRRTVSLDVLAVGRRAVGVTARVELLFRTTGRETGTHRIAGTLDLTPQRGAWQVFGFEIRREDRA